MSVIEELPFILLNYSEQIALYIIIDFNCMALFFAYKLFYNKKNNNAKIRIMNAWFCCSLIRIALLQRQM